MTFSPKKKLLTKLGAELGLKLDSPALPMTVIYWDPTFLDGWDFSCFHGNINNLVGLAEKIV